MRRLRGSRPEPPPTHQQASGAKALTMPRHSTRRTPHKHTRRASRTHLLASLAAEERAHSALVHARRLAAGAKRAQGCQVLLHCRSVQGVWCVVLCVCVCDNVRITLQVGLRTRTDARGRRRNRTSTHNDTTTQRHTTTHDNAR
jgi:hypothetical protein